MPRPIPTEAIRVRMGLHTGEAVKEGDDFFGTHVALAARIAAAARGGQILVSSLLKELTGGIRRVHLRARARHRPEGLLGQPAGAPAPLAGGG